MTVSDKKKGFTLVEALVVAALVGLLGVTILASFTTGMNVWKRAAGLTYAHRQAIVGLERLSLELRRVLNYPPVGFSGTENGCYFANAAADGVRNISYRYVQASESLVRSTQRMTREESDPFEGVSERHVIKNIENVTFGYFGSGADPGIFDFQPQWNVGLGLPRAVRVSFNLKGGQKFEKIILVPTAL